MKVLLRCVTAIDRLTTGVGKCVSWLSGALVLVVCYDVFTRYFLQKSSIAIFELEWHIFSILFLLAAAYTLKEDSHVRVDVLYSRFSPRMQAVVNLLGTLFFLIPFSILVISSSKNFVMMSYSFHETSPDPGGLPYRYLLKLMIPVGFGFVLLQGISLACSSFCTLCNVSLSSENDVKERHDA